MDKIEDFTITREINETDRVYKTLMKHKENDSICSSLGTLGLTVSRSADLEGLIYRYMKSFKKHARSEMRPAQKKVYKQLLKFWNENDFAPTMRCLGQLCGDKSPSVIHNHLQILNANNHVVMNKGSYMPVEYERTKK